MVGFSEGGLIRLIYKSQSEIPTADFEQELGKVFLTARRNNKELDVTGALMYYDKTFSQVLEGPKRAVYALYDKIKADARHSSIELKADEPITDRAFAGWAMANIGEHGDPDTPLIAQGDGVAAGEEWKTTPEQEKVLTMLRDATRSYGRGY